ncbi:hypothetical protein BsWGS_01736 [Bradybaena similaris]
MEQFLREAARPEARSPPGPVAAWKGMGPSGYPKPPSLAVVSCTGYLVLLLCVVFMTAEGFHQGSKECHVERCTNDYEKHRSQQDLAGQWSLDTQAVCTALRTYRHCINKTVGCHGNIMYYSLRNYVRQEMEINNCTANGQTVEPSSNSHSHKPHQHMVPAICLYQGKKIYRHCGLFGDPHLRTFYDEFQTCKVKGAWPLVNNEYLTVQVTNDAVHGNTDATATSKLTVIVKGNICTSTDFQTYQAQTNSLPGTFDDGRITVGQYHSLELVEVDPGRHVEIHIRYINTVVVVRQIGRYFTFSIRMPEELINQSSASQDLQLCVRGCPQSEIINYQEYLAIRKHVPSAHGSPSMHTSGEPRPAMARSHAEKVCRDANLTDFYFDSCVFDLMATGDQNFTLSAMSSLMDVLKLHPSAARTMNNRTDLVKYDERYNRNCGASVSLPWAQCEYRIVHLFLLLVLVIAVCSR